MSKSRNVQKPAFVMIVCEAEVLRLGVLQILQAKQPFCCLLLLSLTNLAAVLIKCKDVFFLG